jgi:L-threonylcarbamoyladenylate synthase
MLRMNRNNEDIPAYLKLKCEQKGAIESCATIVKKGGVIIYPTDTVYGIGCDPFNDRAVERIFDIKRRLPEKALPVLGYSIEDLEQLVKIYPNARKLAQSFWPGPLTIICPLLSRDIISPKLTAHESSLAVRIPGNPCTLSLLKICHYLVGTSANISGESSIKSPLQVSPTILGDFDALLDGGTLDRYSHSTMIRLDEDDTVTFVRKGPITESDIMTALSTS